MTALLAHLTTFLSLSSGSLQQIFQVERVRFYFVKGRRKTQLDRGVGATSPTYQPMLAGAHCSQ